MIFPLDRIRAGIPFGKADEGLPLGVKEDSFKAREVVTTVRDAD